MKNENIETVALPKEALDYVAFSVVEHCKKDCQGNTYVDYTSIDDIAIYDFVASLFKEPEKIPQVLDNIVNRCLKIWSTPSYGYYAPVLSHALDYALHEEDLALHHYLLLCCSSYVFFSTAFYIGNYKDPFTREELAIQVLESTTAKSAEVYAALETMYYLGLVDMCDDNKHYVINYVPADTRELEYAFNVFEGAQEGIAKNILRPFLS